MKAAEDRVVVALFDGPADAMDVMRDLRELGVSASSDRFAEGVRRGRVVVTAVVPAARVDETTGVMKRHGAIHIDERTRDGAVRVYARPLGEPDPEITLREERVVVEQIPVNRPADEDQGLFREQAFEFPESAEEVVVERELRVVGEVHVGREAHERAAPSGESELSAEQVRQARSEPHPFAADFEGDYRARYAAGGGPWEQYDAAYRWGYTLANQDEWRGRPWADVESTARRTWEFRYPGTWDRFADAIRFGWDRLGGAEPLR